MGDDPNKQVASVSGMELAVLNEWRLQNQVMVSACIKREYYCFEDFTKLLAFFCLSKDINRRK